MSKEKTMREAVHQAVSRAASVLKENDDSFSMDLGMDEILIRCEIHPRQLSLDGELFQTFTCDEVIS
jgi:hypothetical protein